MPEILNKVILRVDGQVFIGLSLELLDEGLFKLSLGLVIRVS